NIRNEENITELFIAEDRSIYLGRIKKLVLKNYAVLALPKIELCGDNEIKGLYLSAEEMYYVSGITRAEDSIWVGRVRRLELRKYAINTLPKIRLHGDNEMDELRIVDVSKSMLWRRESHSGIVKKTKKHIGSVFSLFRKRKAGEPEILGETGTVVKDDGCCSWKIKGMKIENSAMFVLSWVRADRSCVLNRFEVVSKKEDDKNLPLNKRFYLGRIKQNGFYVPEEYKKILEYTVVDDE
ncbi:MAG: uncharacterized protein A8A55_3113, partial [Amphiamblys sp. WSBS2006]